MLVTSSESPLEEDEGDRWGPLISRCERKAKAARHRYACLRRKRKLEWVPRRQAGLLGWSEGGGGLGRSGLMQQPGLARLVLRWNSNMDLIFEFKQISDLARLYDFAQGDFDGI
jgi:hypothetical protein